LADETILVLRDVTELRQRESIRDSFVGILSHELRTPVTTIYAGAKVLARPKGRLDEAARTGIFEDIHSEAERLHRLVEDVVAITRFGEGALEIGTDPVLLQRVVPAVVRSEEGRWPGGAFEVALPSNLPPVAGDMTYVEQIVRNLLANAMKYGGPSSTARIEAEASDDEVTIRVLDNGPGFDPGETDRLFELYYRSPAAARLASGSGIGLFVCAKLVEAMGGRIWARNRPDEGAEFGFTLRVVSDDD
jgi:two-component system sensor histidine kinase KdpD